MTEFTAEPLEAWRYWRIVQVRGVTRLASIMVKSDDGSLLIPSPWHVPLSRDHTHVLLPIVWERTAEARCVSPKVNPHGPVPLDAADHVCPLAGCSCGFYGMKDPVNEEDVVFLLAGGGGWAYGRVLLWGRWIEHEYGWRAQYARPAEICIAARNLTVGQCEELRAYYGCGVLKQEGLYTSLPHRG